LNKGRAAMSEQRRGIRSWRRRGESPFSSRDRGYDDRYACINDLGEWSSTWKAWSDLIGQELQVAFEQFEGDKDSVRYRKAVELYIECGKQMRDAGRDLLEKLSHKDVYPPPDDDKSGADAPRGDLITDSTQPPPPPFGKGGF
jgi:hypothetical protein